MTVKSLLCRLLVLEIKNEAQIASGGLECVTFSLLGWGRCSFTHFTLYRRFPLEDIPADETSAAQWLHKLYQEKVKAPACPHPTSKAGWGSWEGKKEGAIWFPFGCQRLVVLTCLIVFFSQNV